RHAPSVTPCTADARRRSGSRAIRLSALPSTRYSGARTCGVAPWSHFRAFREWRPSTRSELRFLRPEILVRDVEDVVAGLSDACDVGGDDHRAAVAGHLAQHVHHHGRVGLVQGAG